MRRALGGFVVAAVLAAASGCQRTQPPARAFKIGSRSELIGGKRALGEVGDFKLSNGVVQAIVQDVGFSRGFGAFGGSLIDVDLVRGNPASPTTGTTGNDYFTEMFPTFFLQAIEPSKVEVLQDGSEGGAAIVRVSGQGANFISLTKSISSVVLPERPLDYTCDYILEPGKQYLKIVVTLTNNQAQLANFPVTIPFGFVTLLGEGQRLFVPGQAGFDMRFHLEEDVYKRPAAIDALPGEVTSMWTTEGDGVSYALVAGRPLDKSYLENKPTYYPTAKPDSLLIPIASSSFLGSFWAKSPADGVPKGGSLSFTGYLAVGSGDVASVQKVVYELRDVFVRPNGREFVMKDRTAYGTVGGVVREAGTGQPLAGVSVVLKDEQGNFQTQATTLATGEWTAPVPPGRYRAFASERARLLGSSADAVDVAEGAVARLDVTLEQPGELQVVVVDKGGRPLPSKISVEGVYAHTGAEPPRQFLYDLKAGERYRPSDLDDDAADPATRRYLERVFFLPQGSGLKSIRPGEYTVYASRGPEYSLAQAKVTIEAGKTRTLFFTLEQLVPTPGWASADFHVHSVKSVDSDMALSDRVISFAVEGVDFLTATDHNYVTDLQPTIDALALSDWLRADVGLELTSLEMGHFNGFPLQVNPGPVQHGVFKWFLTPPGELFAQLRGLGRDPSKVVVQVNHPRDTVLGYFNAFNLGTYTGTPIPPTSSVTLDTAPLPNGEQSPYHPDRFSLDFEALEVFNGKRPDVMFSYRVPATTPPGPEPSLPACPATGPTTSDCLPAPGEIIERPVKVSKAGEPDRYQLQPAFPGAQDDWFTLLAQGRHLTATGNSDSHGASAEAGLPRTYLEIGSSADGTMRALDTDAIYGALRAGRAVATNGPIIDLTINGEGLGRTVVVPDGRIDVKLVVRAAPWVDVTKVVLRRGGKDQGKAPAVLDTFTVPATQAVVRLDVTKSYANVPDGSFVIAEVFGERSLWPVYTPYEVPSLQISDAVGVIGGAFGFGNTYGKYQPKLQQQVKPYAFTNPIWVSRVARQGLVAAPRVKPVSASEPWRPRMIPDVTKLFQALHADVE